MQRWTLAQQDVISRSTSHFARPEFPTPKRREPRSPPSPFLRSTAPTLPTLAAFILSVLFLAPAGAIHVAPPAQQFHPAIATPVLTTSLSALSIPAGGSVYDTASFTGFANGTVSGGTVTYYLYLGSLTCSSSGGPPITVSTVTVSPLGAIPNSASQTFNSVGPDGWQAAYSGNVNNNPVQSPCEPMNVTVANTTIVTNLSASSITAGSSVHDSATLSGETPSASGTVTYVFYNNLNCTGNATTVSIVTVTAGHVPNSAPHTFNMVGGYGWRAIYSGDANNTGATSSCELLNVSLALPTITTTLSNNTVPAGGAVFDTATLSGATPNAGGTVTYVLFADGNCTGNYTVVSVVTVTGALVPNSASHTFPSAGKYSWEAIYSGDANNSGATSSCEFLNVTSTVRNPTITTTLHNSVIPVAGSVYDSAALTGAAPNAGGTVTYVLFSDGNCTGNSTVVSVVTVTGALVPNSASHFFGNVGSYSWEAIYSGDANDSGATSSCEVLTVTPRVSSITTTLSASSVLEGGSVHDSAALTGVTLNAGGTVTYYWSGTCPPSASHAVGTVTVTSAIVPNSPSVTLNFGIGYFYFYAVYSGDGNNAGAQSPCEQLLVTLSSPTISTNLTVSANTSGNFNLSVPGNSEVWGMVFDPWNGYVYASLVLLDEVMIINGATNTTVATVTVGAYPQGLAYDANNHDVYVTTGVSGGSISVISGVTVIATIHALGAANLAFDDFDDEVYVTSSTTLYIICDGGSPCGGPTKTNQVVSTVSLGAMGGDTSIAYDPNNHQVFVPGWGGFHVFTGATLTTTIYDANYHSGGGGTFDSSDNEIYFVDYLTAKVFIISGGTDSVVGTVPLYHPTYGWAAAYDSDMHTVYATGQQSDLTIVSGIMAVGQLPAPPGPYESTGIAYDSTSHELFVGTYSPVHGTWSVSIFSPGYEVTDTSTLTGATPNAGGTVTYRYFSGNSCQGTPTTVSTSPVVSAHAGPSSPRIFPTETMSYDAVYSGDAYNNPATSPCEPLVSPILIGPPPHYQWPSFLSFSMFCPVLSLVTEPNGSQAGFEANGTEVSTVPGTDLFGPDTEPESIGIPNPDWGLYHLTLVGSPTAAPDGSNFTLLVGALSSNGTRLANSTYHGVTYPGATQTFTVNVSATGITISPGPVQRKSEGSPWYQSEELWAGGLGAVAVLAAVLAVMWRGRSRRAKDTGNDRREKDAPSSTEKVQATDPTRGKSGDSVGVNEEPVAAPASPKVNDPLRGVLAPSPEPAGIR